MKHSKVFLEFEIIHKKLAVLLGDKPKGLIDKASQDAEIGMLLVDQLRNLKYINGGKRIPSPRSF